jgi:large subunit ribosomal protein L22
MEVKAKARHIKMSPKKVRLVANLVRGMDVSAAEAQLTFLKKAAARPVLKLIQSARANATHNFKLDGDGLFIKTITVDGGPVLHRWMPRAFGRATPLRKRSSHITVVLAERVAEGAPKEIAKAVVKKDKTTEDSEKKTEVKKAEEKKPAAKSATADKKAPAKKAEAKSTKSDQPAAKKATKKADSDQSAPADKSKKSSS